jgi:hypothetical protein
MEMELIQLLNRVTRLGKFSPNFGQLPEKYGGIPHFGLLYSTVTFVHKISVIFLSNESVHPVAK